MRIRNYIDYLLIHLETLDWELQVQRIDQDIVSGKIRMRTGAATNYIPVSDADGVMTWTDPSTISTADDQQLTLDTLLSLNLENGGSVDLLPFMDNVDSQYLYLDSINSNLYIMNGNTIDLSYLENTDNQQISMRNDTLFLEKWRICEFKCHCQQMKLMI